MTRRPTQVFILFLYFLPIIIVGSAILYVLLMTDIAEIPISALPAWYWALLTSIPLMTLLPLIFARLFTRRIAVTKTTSAAETKAFAWVSVVAFAFTAVMFLGIGILSINSRHQGGGRSMFFIAIGIHQLVLVGSSVIRLRNTH